ncbi:MAG: hypothetical protein H6822_25650 [Planctomycetaceae bacterium]|nr:hypothetical protein [Planctomycetaceae bacterium]
MIEPEEHLSPDGTLALQVKLLDGGDVAIGFRGHAWHTHADILASVSGCPESDAVRRFVEDVLADRAIIAVQSFDDVVHDVWITDDPSSHRKYQQANETLNFRYWSGRKYTEAD